MTDRDLEQLAVDTIKALAMDAVQKANSGHPGMPMGMADIAVVLWTRFLTLDPDEPTWPDRDRFVLSNGHGSMLLYALLHLSGFPMPMEQIKQFRQFGSHTAGHPEIDQEIGIETTTGPLGQGFGTGVGMAIAEAHLRAQFGADLVDHRTIAFCSDGDLMEGVSAEASSIAGHLGLGRLLYYYDDNDISIDGSTDITFSEDVAKRFEAVGWHVNQIDGHDREAVDQATREALGVEDRPSLVICRTHIAHGAPNAQDTAEAHGSPLGEEEVRRAKEWMGWDPEAHFVVPEEVRDLFTRAMQRGRDARAAWVERRDKAFEADPELAQRWRSFWQPERVKLDDPGFETGASIATRSAAGKIFDQIGEKVPNFLGGAADLVASTKTSISTSAQFTARNRIGRNLAFGVREHAMGTIVNGMAIHGGLRPYAATFFVFSDYMRPAVRISALAEAPSIWVYTHDSIFLGEDGPTHQPIEHLASLRAMPHMWVMRPADAGEVVEAWEVTLNRTDGPTAMLLTRQNVPVLDRSGRQGGVARGGYVLREGNDVVVVATGSEVHVALEAADLLAERDISARVVSLPCWELFFEQDASYRAELLGHGIPRVSVEAAATFGWERVIGSDGLAIGIDHFGASAPWQVIAEEWGFTPEAIAERIGTWLRR